MGKYMKKSKISIVAVMDCSLGVRTRAKTLALKRLQSADPVVSYLQLRSRRLQKPIPPPPVACEVQRSRSVVGRESCDRDSSSMEAGSRVWLGSDGSGSVGSFEEEGEVEDLGFEGGERGTRESTPCSYIRDSTAIGTPGSTTRRSGSKAASRRLGNDVQLDIPTSQEIEEFFARAEQQQQGLFMEKYNFDVVKDLPLPGRYDWELV